MERYAVARERSGSAQAAIFDGLVLRVAGDLRTGADVTVIIRPENLKADAAGEVALGTARVREAVFQGAHDGNFRHKPIFPDRG